VSLNYEMTTTLTYTARSLLTWKWQRSHSLAYKKFQDFPGAPKRFSRTLS